MPSLLAQLLNLRTSRRARRPRLVPEGEHAAVYAIGDVHGRLDLLLGMEQVIGADAADVSGRKLIVMLGDYVDRGPQSAQVLDHLMAPPPAGFERLCLAGNHEEMMLDFVRRPDSRSDWLQYGGIDTLHSYGVTRQELEDAFADQRSFAELVQRAVPAEHVTFIAGLAGMIILPGLVFVHAGIRPGVAFAAQVDEDLLWIRHLFINSTADHGAVVVHGHTPIPAAEILANRIAVDTGAFATGMLSAVALRRDGAPRILEVRAAPAMVD